MRASTTTKTTLTTTRHDLNDLKNQFLRFFLGGGGGGATTTTLFSSSSSSKEGTTTTTLNNATKMRRPFPKRRRRQQQKGEEETNKVSTKKTTTLSTTTTHKIVASKTVLRSEMMMMSAELKRRRTTTTEGKEEEEEEEVIKPMRIADILMVVFPERFPTKTAAKKAIRRGDVRVNEKTADVGFEVQMKEDDEERLKIDIRARMNANAAQFNNTNNKNRCEDVLPKEIREGDNATTVAYEDEECAVVRKSFGIPTLKTKTNKNKKNNNNNNNNKNNKEKNENTSLLRIGYIKEIGTNFPSQPLRLLAIRVSESRKFEISARQLRTSSLCTFSPG